ncbi:unnamed protein product [Polarella glacialis]|uniref:Major facilitator superfamily (MFS) profile domain-containing protein n=1 Tax=Polarella glacialis TaxID=89957 RepID=A0A813JT78_POLGL|nr:unnamed protein product [Polarella glacialis]CAE8685879.1 unnamed protein product [Polarella glacialis]
MSKNITSRLAVPVPSPRSVSDPLPVLLGRGVGLRSLLEEEESKATGGNPQEEDPVVLLPKRGGLGEIPQTHSSKNQAECQSLPFDELDEPTAGLMPPWTSLGLILYTTFLAGAGLVIVIPTADDYAERLEAGQAFSGLMIGSVPLFATIGVVLNYWQLKKKWSFKSVIYVNCFGAVCGNVLYALAGLTKWKWTLLMARGLIGLCNGLVIGPLYISRSVGLLRRSEVMFYFSAVSTLGYAVGPCFAWALAVFVKELRIENLLLDSDTAPGWLMAALYFAFMLLFVLLFHEPETEAESDIDESEGKRVPTIPSSARPERLPVCALITCLWPLSVAGFVNTSCEVFIVTLAQRSWGWSISASALLLAGLMAIAGVINFLTGRLLLPHMKSDRAGLLASCLCGALGSLPVFDFGLTEGAQLVCLSVGLVLLLTAVNMARAFSMSLATKLVPGELKPLVNMLSMGFQAMGRGAGAVFGALFTPATFAPVQMGLCLMAALVFATCFSHMKPHKKAT